MNQDYAVIPQLIAYRGSKALENMLSVVLGVLVLSILAQVSFQLPWTPVPITGQTFGVSVIALSWGRKRTVAILVAYLFLGAMGLPIFAMGKSGLLVGPTTGYLIGMVIASYWMGALADRGWIRTWWQSYLIAASGSVVIFSCGVIGLSFFLPAKDLLIAGVLPFLPGDFLKTLLASFIAFKSQSILEKNI